MPKRIYRSTTSGNVPTSLVSGQLAINEADGKLFYRAAPSGTVTQFTVAYSSLTGTPSTFAPSSHTHGNITNAGAIGSTSNQIVVTTTSGVLTTATIGSGLSLSGGTLTATGGGGGSSGISAYAASKIFR